MAIGPYKIRPAEPADVSSVVRLDRATSSLPHWANADYDAALHARQEDVTAGGVRRCFLVAESEKSIVGFAVGRATFIEGDTFAELESVAVLDSARRSGIGRALCTAIIDWAYSCKATSIELEVRSRSEAPIALYGSLGFVELGRRSGYYRNPVDDAVLMRLILSQE